MHHIDNFTVTVACAKNPVSTKLGDVNGVIDLSTVLGRPQERIQRIVDECGQALPGGHESIPIPDSGTWMDMMWHFGVDTPNYRELNLCMSWKNAQDVLLREYNRKNEGKERMERQEYPKISLAEAGNWFLS